MVDFNDELLDTEIEKNINDTLNFKLEFQSKVYVEYIPFKMHVDHFDRLYSFLESSNNLSTENLNTCFLPA